MNFTPASQAPASPAPASATNARNYVNPYLAGVGIGLMLLAAFVLVGRGLGASGAFSSVVATTVSATAPGHAAANPAYAGYLGDGTVHPLRDWLVFEIIGVTIGGLLSAWLAGRLRLSIERGSQITDRARLL